VVYVHIERHDARAERLIDHATISVDGLDRV